MDLNKALQQKIGELIGKDYFKLEFGCKYLNLHNQIETFINNAGMNKHRCISEDNQFDETLNIFIKEIIGQEPTLNDILLAMEKSKISYELSIYHNNFYIEDPKNDFEDIVIDLEKSIFNQSEEVKQQLLYLISK